jgi:hypothetical protein
MLGGSRLEAATGYGVLRIEPVPVSTSRAKRARALTPAACGVPPLDPIGGANH